MPGAGLWPTAKLVPLPLYSIDLSPVAPISRAIVSSAPRWSCAAVAAGSRSRSAARDTRIACMAGLLFGTCCVVRRAAAAAGPSGEAGLQELERSAREGPHVGLAVALA